MKKTGAILITIFVLMLSSSLVLAAENQTTDSIVYVLNSAPTVRALTITDPAEVGTELMTITANITDPNGIPGDFGTAFAVYNNGSADIATVYLSYNATSELYENNTFTIPEHSVIGTWTVTVNGTDTGGLSDTNSTTFTVQDTVAPVASDLLPSNNTNYAESASVPVNFTITDLGTIDTAYITINWSGGIENVTLTNSSGVWTGTFTTTSTAGNYTMETFANDTGGNPANVLTGYFTIGDLIDPVIQNINDTPDPVDPGQAINFTANVTDNEGVDTVIVGVYNGTEYNNHTMTCTGAVTDRDCYYDDYDTSISAGTYNYTVYANDTSGNEATPVTSNFTVNTQVAITLSQVPIDFGNTTIPVSERRADNGTAGDGYTGGTVKGFPAVVNNTGNVDIDLSINGTDLVGQTNGAYTVGVGNVTYNTTDSTPGTELTTTEATIATTVSMHTPTDVYFWITLPEGLISQSYQGTVNIYATQS